MLKEPFGSVTPPVTMALEVTFTTAIVPKPERFRNNYQPFV